VHHVQPLSIARLLVIAAVSLAAVALAASVPAASQNSVAQRVADLEAQVGSLAGQVTALTEQLAALTQIRIIDVHCETGEKIGAALVSAQNHPAHVLINVFGVCTENIQVSRSRITIRAGAPSAGIAAANLALPVVRNSSPISGLGALLLEGLTISGGPAGVLADFGTEVRLLNCIVRDNFHGVDVDHESIVRLESTHVEANGTGVSAKNGGHVFISGGALQNNLPGDGLQLEAASADIGNGALITGNGRYGISLTAAATLRVGAATISSSGITGIFVNGGSLVHLGSGATITANTQSGISLMDTSLVMKHRALADIHVTNNGLYGIVCSLPPAVNQIVGFTFQTGDISGNPSGNINCPISPGPFSQ
jgi:outer membrane murein-binding lipoprotein Lpp